MADSTGKQLVDQWQRKWQRQLLLLHWMRACIPLLMAATLYRLLPAAPLLIVPLALLCSLAGLLLRRKKTIDEKAVIRYLDQTYPQLEESTGLLLAPPAALSTLQRLQADKTQRALLALQTPAPLKQKLQSGILLLLGVAVVCGALAAFVHRPLPHFSTGNLTRPSRRQPENKLAAVAGLTLTLVPPAYTGKPPRTQTDFSLVAEEDATATWVIHTSAPAAGVQLLFNDSTRQALQAADAAHTVWKAQRTLHQQGFYQVQLNKERSPLYKVELIRDQPPVITMQSPRSSTLIDYGQAPQVQVSVQVTDDYGIAGAGIAATIASGSGEAVKFREQLLSFDQPFHAHQPSYHLSRLLNLTTMGLQPGDELYFYLLATDNHGQQTRSDIFMVTLADTAQLMNLNGLANSVNLKPEYFRSQRQIILETEQLLKAKDTLSLQAFRNKSNDLGIDQKLLRLRYGKFLGEEAESNIGEPRVEEETHEHASATQSDSKDQAAAILDQFTDKHDNAEDASFFDPATKRQLKATLAEMWNAELQLRSYQPRAALPYAYKALRLLKDLQQKSRAYVGKTGVKTTPLQPEKRLSGELDKIQSPLTVQQYQQQLTNAAAYRTALGLVEQLKTGEPAGPGILPLLQQTTGRLSREAVVDPARYLNALEAARRILLAIQQHNTPRMADLYITGNALQQLATPPPPLPGAPKTVKGESLPQQYFRRLTLKPAGQ